MSKYSDEQLRTMRHMLGIDDPWVREPYPFRDYYCANPGDEKLHTLAKLGGVELYETRGSYEWFRCTDDGRAAALRSHKTIRKSKGARVYSKFCDIRECYPGLTFKAFLTSTEFKDSRSRA